MRDVQTLVADNIKMMRYRGKFQRSNFPQLVIEPTDEGQILEDKWKKWSELEAWKRSVSFWLFLLRLSLLTRS